ncbi:hypothetical protein BDZ89DRAFT_740080 [Hymenopellis radicata]|nr:hypothetical protein BDZ89DRAFT_740080 [Hymenopellis radicata]
MSAFSTPARPPQTVTISSHEDGDEAPPEVPLQQTYKGLLGKLNEVLGTDYTLDPPPVVELGDDTDDSDWSNVEDVFDVPADEDPFTDLHPLATLLRDCARFDFGTAYAYLRTWWYVDHGVAQMEMFRCQTNDRMFREAHQWAHQSAPTIDLPATPPRRVWDLYSNRVVPRWIVGESVGAPIPGRYIPTIVGISHSWMSEELRHAVYTPINAFEWPVPIPVDTTLERVRVELLNLGLEYVWLDVLCLRQIGRGGVDEELRREEWQVDVPTIGNVYRDGEKVVHYCSGLGRPFRIGNLDSDRHWLNRAWTLQEIAPNTVIAGMAPDSPIIDDKTVHLDSNVHRFSERLASLATFSKGAQHIFPVLAAMRHRAATSELDKISGLSYLLGSTRLPPYIATEAAWWRFLETIAPTYRGDLFFLYPEPGNGKCFWSPSWQQVKDGPTLPSFAGGVLSLSEKVWYDSSYHIYRHRGYRIDGCLVDGFDHSEGAVPRTGRVSMVDVKEGKHEFEALAFHAQPILAGEYVLIGSEDLEHWVIGWSKGEKQVEKVSVLRIVGGEGVIEKLKALVLGRLIETGLL